LHRNTNYTTRSSAMSRTPSPPAFSSKYAVTVAPSRRPPPTALHLVSGPLPPRNKPKHTLPSLPRPAFYPKAHKPKDGAEARARRKAKDVTLVEEHLTYQDVQPIIIPSFSSSLRSHNGSTASLDSSSDGSSSGNSSPVSEAGSFHHYHSAPSPVSYRFADQKAVRGPWDHSGAIRVPFDVNVVLAPPRPVAVKPY